LNGLYARRVLENISKPIEISYLKNPKKYNRPLKTENK